MTRLFIDYFPITLMVIATVLFVSQLLQRVNTTLIPDPAKRFVTIFKTRQMDRDILLFLIGLWMIVIGLWMILSSPEIQTAPAPPMMGEGTVYDLVGDTDGSHIDDFTPVLFIEPIKQAQVHCQGNQRTQILVRKLLLIPNNSCDAEPTVELVDGSKYSYPKEQFGEKNALYIQFRDELKTIAAIKLKFNAGSVEKMGYQTKNIDTEFRVTPYGDSIRIELHNDIQSIYVNRGDSDLFKSDSHPSHRSAPKGKASPGDDKAHNSHRGDPLLHRHNSLYSRESNTITIKRWDNEKVPSVFMVLSDGFSFFPVEVSLPVE